MSRSSTKCKLDSSSHPGMMTLRKRSTTLKELLANHGFVYFYLLYFFLFSFFSTFCASVFYPFFVLLCASLPTLSIPDYLVTWFRS